MKNLLRQRPPHLSGVLVGIQSYLEIFPNTLMHIGCMASKKMIIFLSMKKPERYIDLMDQWPPWYCWGEPTLEREGKQRQKWWWTQTENVRKNYPHSKAAFTVKMISHKIIKWRIVPSPEWPSPSTHQRETSGRRLGACSPAPILKQF